MTARVDYTGGLRTQCVHLKSGNTIVTDAPTDNHGKGEAFSPTDLAATSLACCMLTVMDIHAQGNGYSIEGATAEVVKHMTAAPRRIAAIDVKVVMPTDKKYSFEQKKTLERVGRTCPVALSLHPDIDQRIQFEWND